MKLSKILFTLTIYFSSLSLFSQTQSLWSEIRKTNADSVGLNALQYQIPLYGPQISFFDQNLVKGINDYAQVDSWLTRDFNNDGFADVFLTFYVSGERTPAPFMLLIYDKNSGTFKDQSYRLKNNIGQPDTRKAISADFNGDGFLDLAAVSHPECDTCRFSYFDIVLSNSDTTWTQKTLRKSDRFKCEGYHHGVAVGDIDKDGDVDIIVANENTCIQGCFSYINDGKGNFKETRVASPYWDTGPEFVTSAWTVELADINHDGCLDLFYGHDAKNTRILYGNCKEKFDYMYQDIIELNFPHVLDYDIRDLDGDDDLDLLLTTTSSTGRLQLVFRENKGNDNLGKVIWGDRTESITQSLKAQGFYPDEEVDMPYSHFFDINSDGILDIIPQNPLSNSYKYFGQWILLGESAWNFKYKKLPFAEPPKTISSSFVNGKVNLRWERVKQSYSTGDGGISKWAIYISDKNWGDRSQVSKPIIVSATETKSENGFDQLLLDPTSKEMFFRISPIDSSGIEWPLSNILKVSILPPSISSATICDGNSITIIGTNFVGINKLTVGSLDVPSFSVLSDKTIQATLNTGQSGNINLSTIAGSAIFSNVTFIIPPAQSFVVIGKKTPFKGEIETYSVPVSPGVSFNWTFPDGWTQASGGNSNSVTVKTGTVGGIIQVIPSAICGTLKPISSPVSVYTYVPDDNFRKALRELGIDKENKPDAVLTSSLLSVTSLNLDSSDIADLTGIQDFVNLKTLKCRSNKLNKLDLSGNKLLEELFCGYNNLTSIDLSKNITLKILSCEWNQIRTLDVSQNTMLNVLGCDGIPITSLNVSNNKELVLLSIYSQAINSIDISKNTKLTYFSCVDLQLTELDVSKNINLGLLNFSGNQLSRVDVSKNPALTYLGCADNKLVYLNMKNGNNKILKTFYTNNNPNLTCISVDDPVQSLTYIDWKKDATASYSDNCIPTGIELTELNKSIVVKPNPSNGIFKIEGLPSNQKNTISVYTIDGRLIRKLFSNAITEIIDLSGQVSGVYLLFINNQPFKIMKE